ncbi:MAG TPA: hypothetical protein VM052_04190 [Candidatus Limnocylindrales bacterium]|nr:hypothetical protein [Candidatus Limnocylindrales bacterium]
MEKREVIERRTVEQQEPPIGGVTNVNVGDGATETLESDELVDDPVGVTNVNVNQDNSVEEDSVS